MEIIRSHLGTLTWLARGEHSECALELPGVTSDRRHWCLLIHL